MRIGDLIHAFQAALLVAFFVVLVLFAGRVSAQEMTLDLNRLPVLELLRLYYAECDQDGFVIAGELAESPATAVAQAGGLDCDQLSQVVGTLLADSGIVRVVRPGVDLLRLKATQDADRSGWEVFQYRPRYRDALALADQVSFVVRVGQWAHSDTGFVPVSGAAGAAPAAPPRRGTGASLVQNTPDRLVFFAPPSEVAAVRALLPQLDRPVPAVTVEVGVYEFSDSSRSGSALTAIGDLFGGKVRLELGRPQGGDSVRLSIDGLDLAIAKLQADERFRLVTRPRLLVRDGAAGSFFSGEDVRVDGAIVIDADGRPVASRETLSAGVTLQVTPRVFQDVVELELYQAVSSFAAGSGEEPTVLKRDVTTSFPAVPGEVYVIAGLDASRKASGEAGPFRWFRAKSASDSRSELVLLVQVAPLASGVVESEPVDADRG